MIILRCPNDHERMLYLGSNDHDYGHYKCPRCGGINSITIRNPHHHHYSQRSHDLRYKEMDMIALTVGHNYGKASWEK